MKKLLSLLLALTMVLSLAVVPARAAANGTATVTVTGKSGDAAVPGDNLTFSLGNCSVTDDRGTVSNVTPGDVTWTVNGAASSGTYTVTSADTSLNVAYSTTLTYTVTPAEGDAITDATYNLTGSTTVAVSNPVAALTSGTFNGRAFSNKSVTYYASEAGLLSDATKWGVDGYTVNSATVSGSNCTLALTSTSNPAVTGTMTVALTAATVTLSSGLDNNEAVVGGKLTLTAACAVAPIGAQYYWSLDGAQETAGTTTYAVSTAAAGAHTVKCAVKTSAGALIAEATANVNVIADNFSLNLVANPAQINAVNTSSTVTGTIVAKGTTTALDGATGWNFTLSGNTTSFNRTAGSAANSIVLTAKEAGTVTVTATASYKGKTYSATTTVTSNILSYTLPAIQSGSSESFPYATLLYYANTISNRPAAGFRSISVNAQPANALGTLTTTSTACTFDTARATKRVGVAQFTATAIGNDGKNYTVLFNLPIEPISTTYEAQYPQPISTSTTSYRYSVEVPSGYVSYYVVGSPNQTTRPTDWSNPSGAVYTARNLLSLAENQFVNGKCTLWIVTATSQNRLYCGSLEVYLQNNDISYNATTGSTIKFSHSDFTGFMNDMAGKNTSSYLTFNYVRFLSVPAASQGTLYYNNQAMTTRSGSNNFNANTQITNLDNVSFTVNPKATVKEIILPFQLVATRYNSSSSTRGQTVTYTGRVVISVVREDIVYSVAPGETVRFTDSDFLRYLQSSSTAARNYTIDYVTFDQSAVSTLNEGALYAYYGSFNYGNAVKNTDRFYYNTTNYNQTALSNVAFRASSYAKTGTTAYIPFTMHVRTSTNGTATRQVTGTVAVRIAQTMNFSDVKAGDYFYDSVKWAVGQKITNGTSATTFSPYKTCTRAEIVTFLWRAAGSPTPTSSRNPFTDVKSSMGSDFYNAILWASQKGITAGTTATTFSPNATCTRAQIVTFLYRYAGKPSGNYANPFNDVNQTEHGAYYSAILWAVGKGITTGTTASTFSPSATCNRAEAVTFLYRYVNGL